MAGTLQMMEKLLRPNADVISQLSCDQNKN